MDAAKRRRLKITDWLLEMILLAMVLFFSLTADNFLTVGNLLNILRNISFKGIIACFMTMVIISGEIDLSVGSTVAFAGVLTAYMNKLLLGMGVAEIPAILTGMAIAIAASGVIGVLMALVVTRLRVPSFIVTMAAMQLLRGGALLIANGFPIQGYPGWFKFLGSGYIGRIPFPAIVFVLFLMISYYILKHTPFGRAVYAVGSNPEAAGLSGLNVNRIKSTVFMLTSAAAGLAGIMVSAQLNSGSPNVGESYEMDAIASVIIGGASLAGGAGTIRGTLVGCIFTGVLMNSMTLMGVNDYWQYIVRGALIVFAVFLNTMVKERLKERGW